MNRLPTEHRTQILTALLRGDGINAACRLTGASKNTVLKLIADVGTASAIYQDNHLRALPSRRIQFNEILAGAGTSCTYAALDLDTHLAICWRVAECSEQSAAAFAADVTGRLTGRAIVTSNAPSNYPAVIDGGAEQPDRGDRLALPFDIESLRVDAMHAASELFAGPAKLIKHLHAISLHFMTYNFVTVHPSMGCCPAMAAGLTDAIWSTSDVIRMADQLRDVPMPDMT